jgi:hypothetical protein
MSVAHGIDGRHVAAVPILQINNYIYHVRPVYRLIGQNMAWGGYGVKSLFLT